MSATALSKALNDAGALPAPRKSISAYPGRWAPSTTQLTRRNGSQAGMVLPVSSPPHPAVSNTVLFVALALFLAGCGSLQSGTSARTNLLAPADTRTVHDLAPTTTQPETPSKPEQPVPQNPQRISVTTSPPAAATKGPERLVATTGKGAEKLIAPTAPALAPARERTPLPAQPPDPKPTIMQDSGVVAAAPVEELVIRGPPHQTPQPRSAIKALLWLGLGLGGAALAVLARLFVIRRARPPAVSTAGKDELKMPSELLFKESVMAPQEPVVAEKP